MHLKFLQKTKNQTRDLINQTTKLQGESQKIQLRSQIVELFLAKFQLKQEEIQALKGGRDGQLHQVFSCFINYLNKLVA